MNSPSANQPGRSSAIPAAELNLQVEIHEEFLDHTGEANFVPAPCQVACPIGTDAPSYLAYIWEGDLEGALEAITATNPLSSICGRVCDAPCEPACRRADSDGPIAIRNLKRYVMEKLGKTFKLPPVPMTRKETVAIVGSGPTGLTAAQDLAEAGYEVHIYEMTDRLGGLIIWGIPAFRLPQETLREDIDRILHHCPGIQVHLDCGLGIDISLDELKERHDAVLLAIGSWWGKKMEIPGEDDKGVVDGVTFLRRVNGGERPTLPESVVVIGGGDVAMDACRVAKRLPGCKDVKVLYRRGPEEIPARRDELHGAIKEGIEFVHFTQPTEISADTDGFMLGCVKTELGDPEADGRRRPILIPGSKHDIHCGMVITAVGQKGASVELTQRGMMKDDKIITDWDTMRTPDLKVFGAGDGSFGPSTLINSIFHGHRGAYYVKAFLEGRENPVPYRTPYRTRRVPVSQDPEWEIFNRQEQEFYGVGEAPVNFPEIEATYEPLAARQEAARCFRCDAENGTQEYSVNNREDIFTMARTAAGDYDRLQGMLNKHLIPRDNPFPANRPATVDDIHFLPANLSRLVIDPYREACSTGTIISADFELVSPYLAAGCDDAPDQVRDGLARALAHFGCPYIGVRSLGEQVPWFQLSSINGASPDPQAAGVVYSVGDTFTPFEPARVHDQQLLGLAVHSGEVAAAVPFALEAGCDFIVLDATAGVNQPWAELRGDPDLTVLRNAIAVLRRLRCEGDISLIYYGGMRSGTDAAKVLAIGCQAVVFGAALGFAAGGRLVAGRFEFDGDRSVEERGDAIRNFLQASIGEVSMMARCAGKTKIHNLEPEDLRAITLATAEATGVPLIGT